MSGDAPTPDQPASKLRPYGIRAGSIFGVPLVVSPVALLLLGFGMLVVPGALQDHVSGLSTAGSVIAAAVLIVSVYGAVLAHEAGHVLVARALGLRVGRVLLQPLGAQSEVLDEPQTPARTFLVAAIGPLMSVLLAGIGAAIGGAFDEHTIGWELGWLFAWINGTVAAFNLLPGLPLDGGQIVRAALWRLTGDKQKATLAAGRAGLGVAFALLVLAIRAPAVIGSDDRVVGSAYLILLAFIIAGNATAAIQQAQVGAAVPTLRLAELLRPAMTVEAQLPLAEAVRRARIIGARALVVVDSRDHWSGIVSEQAVQSTPVERQPWMSVSELARPVEAGLVLPSTLDGEALVRAIQQTPASEYLIADGGMLRGVLARADLIAALRAAGVR